YESIEAAGYERGEFLSSLEAFLADAQTKYKPTVDPSLYDLSVAELIDHIEATHHLAERNLLSEVDEKLNTILRAHYTHHKEELLTVHSLFSNLRKELLQHFAEEEEEVFPLLRTKATPQSIMMVESLEDDHEAAGDLIKSLQEATRSFSAPADGCPTYVATYALMKTLVEDVFLHIFKENSILFPKYKEGAKL
ncbi:MAG TPA: hemerythrin domain-containing protein, partial [Sphaerochaeta sp.]|nr:hemerythrin domain-containing protein [Sphaerochaeta sp.]